MLKLNEKLLPVILCTGMCLAISGCLHENGQSQSETSQSEASQNNEVNPNTNENNTDNSTANNTEIKEYQYPLVITPTLTKKIDFAIESEDIFCIFNEEKYGYITKSGEEITDYIYDAAFPFSEGFACVVIDGKYGFIDKNGEESIPCIYDDASSFSDGLAYFATEDTYGFLKTDGTIAFYLDCDSVSSFREGMAYFSIGGKYGYIDQTGQSVIEPVYSDADYFKDGLAFVEKNGYKGAINSAGKEIIPIQYNNVIRSGEWIVAATGDETEYYTLNGEKASEAEYDASFENSSDTDEEATYTVKDDDSMFIVSNQDGTEILSMTYEYVNQWRIYPDTESYIIRESDANKTSHIVILGEKQEKDLSRFLLKNSITPRQKSYWNLTHGKAIEVVDTDEEAGNQQKFDSWSFDEYIKKAKLYDVDHSGQPVLYYCELPVVQYNFPLSSSGIYGIQDGKIVSLVTGYECGGSARGDSACFYQNVDSKELFIGTQGASGGFGGFSNYNEIFDYKAGKAEPVLSYLWIGQISGNYEEEVLLENAHLFYDDEGVPYTKETIQEAEQVNEYQVNDTMVTQEEYKKASQQYRAYTLFE